jgi:putative membrane protein
VASPSDHLANERTFLAWVRTGIALIGLGLVIAKFAIFLSLINVSKQPTSSVRLGELLVLMGAVVIVYGLYDYLTVEKMLKSGNFRARTNSHVAFIAVVMALTISLALLAL